MRLDIQLYGGRGSSSGNSRVGLNKVGKKIMQSWENKQTATEEEERQFRTEVNKMSYDRVLKLAEILDKADLTRTTTGGAFAIEVAMDNVIEVGKKKNPNKWYVDFGKWRS